jgi:uncharacterized delta-60 repeat protein
VARFNANGTADSGFGNGGKAFADLGDLFSGNYSGVALQADGKIVVSGTDAITSGAGKLCLVRYNADGTLDTTFGSSGNGVDLVPPPAGFSYAQATGGVEIQSDGKIVASVEVMTSSEGLAAAVRVNADGTLDTSYGNAGWATVPLIGLEDTMRASALQPDGRLLLAGLEKPTLNASDVMLIRFTGDTTTYMVNLAGDAGTGSGLSGDIRYCVNQADKAANAGSTLTFDTAKTGKTITLTHGQLTISNNMTITGTGAGSLTISGDKLSRVFDISSTTATVTISGLTISGGSVYYGAAIFNYGSLTISDSNVSGNTASVGGGIVNSGGSLTVNDSILSGNSASIDGGGIYNTGSLTVNNSTLYGNAAKYGSGIYISGNSSSALLLNNATIANNRASAVGGGVDVAAGSNVLLHNTLIASNHADGKPSDVSGSLKSSSNYNLIDDGSGSLSTANHNLLGTSAKPLNPLLAPLANYGGPTRTMALLPGSPALNVGSSVYGGSADQRGKLRNGATDIGAFESQGFKLAISGGNNQSAAFQTAFAKALGVTVTATNAIEPVAGGHITFTAPASGASAVLKSSPATISSNGQASVTATANGTAGTYTVSASAAGVPSPAKFSLTNTAPASTLAPLSRPPAGLAQPVLAPFFMNKQLLSSLQTAATDPSSSTSPPPSPSLAYVDAALVLFLDGVELIDKWMEDNTSVGEAFYGNPQGTEGIEGDIAFNSSNARP